MLRGGMPMFDAGQVLGVTSVMPRVPALSAVVPDVLNVDPVRERRVRSTKCCDWPVAGSHLRVRTGGVGPH